MYSIWSAAYLEYELNSYTCYLSEKLWRRINNEQISNRMFAKINKGDRFWICAVGAPIDSPFPEESVFVPHWMLEQIDTEGLGELLEIDWMPGEAFDETTKVVLKCLDGDEEEVENIQEFLSNELTKLAILKKDTIIQLENLRYLVVNLEPSSVVLCQGDDVALEFAVSRPPTPTLTSSPPPSIVQPTAPYLDDEVLPFLETEEPPPPPYVEETEQPQPQGNLLGGVQRTERFNPWRNKDFKPPNS